MLALSVAATSSPVLVGHVLFGANEMVGDFVKSLIPQMSGKEFDDDYRALGVVLRGQLVGGVVFSKYSGFNIHFSCAFKQVGWARRETLRTLFSFPFVQLDCVRLTATTGRKNKVARKALTDVGFTHEGVCRRGYDGREDAFIYGMLKEQCKWLGNKNGS